MREIIINHIYRKMKKNNNIFFLTSDMGSIALDKIRNDFPDRFINVGISEQNLINMSIGLALEKSIVFSYLMSPFVLRAYEQIKHISIISEYKQLNINIISSDAQTAGVFHECNEDISIIKLLKNIEVFEVRNVNYTSTVMYYLDTNKPKYIRIYK